MTVVNKRHHIPTSNDIYIGRGSKWGNPFHIGKDGTRQDVIDLYEEYIIDKFNDDKEYWLEELLKLEEKTLVCYCKPLACHGDVLEALIKEYKK